MARRARARARRAQPRDRLRVRVGVHTAAVMYPFASLPDNLAAFCDVLRRTHRFRIGPGELRDAARALEFADLGSEPAVRNTLRPILSANRDEAALFDSAFRSFFIPATAEPASDEVAARGAERGPLPADRRRRPNFSAGPAPALSTSTISRTRAARSQRLPVSTKGRATGGDVRASSFQPARGRDH